MKFKTTLAIICSLVFVICCQSKKITDTNTTDSTENKFVRETKSSSLKVYDSISDNKNLLDTNLYNGYYPPESVIMENLKKSSIIAEGRILEVDSISSLGAKVISFQIDSLWKGKVPTEIIKFIVHSDFTLTEYKQFKKVKRIIFLTKGAKETYYDYKDSIEYFPVGPFSSFSLDRPFKKILLQKIKK